MKQRPLGHLGLFLCEILCAAGYIEEALSASEKAIELSVKHKEKRLEGLSRVMYGRIKIKNDISNADLAEESILRGISILENRKIRPQLAKGYLYLGELYLEIGKEKKGLRQLQKADNMFREMEMNYWADKTKDVLKEI